MTATLSTTDLPGRRYGPPGIYIRRRQPFAPTPPAMLAAVPAFVGFTDREDGGQARQFALVLTRWDPDLISGSVAPAQGSFLSMAVRGFFANGGKRCVVITVAKRHGAGGMIDVLAPGGPLEDRSDIDLLCVPDAVSELIGDADPYRVQLAALDYCQRMGDRFAILDAGRAGQTRDPDLLDAMQRMVARMGSPFGAFYFPWITAGQTQDQTAATPEPTSVEWRRQPRKPSVHDRGSSILGPPCGHIAGLYARTEASIGPQQSPANLVLEDVVDVSIHLDDREHALLNDAGVNCLRSRRGGGVEVRGARTLSNHNGLEYVSSARVYLGFKRWLAVGMRDLVFEPNDELLRARVRRRLEARCRQFLESGALAGASASDAFFVKCDDETNGAGATEKGRIVADVGLALSVPAEYVIIRVEHDPGGTGPGGLS
jgi:uncharacterized protein